MISFALTDDQQAAREMFEALASEQIQPFAAATDADGATHAQARQAIADAGIFPMMLDSALDEELGPQSRLLNCLLLEELGRADTSLAVSVGGTIGYMRAILDHGSAGQIAVLQELISQGRAINGAVLLLEPGFGAGPSRIATEVKRTADGFLLSGTKAYVPIAASRLLVIARLDAGYGAFLVDRDQPGLTIKATPTLGLRGLDFGQANFADTPLPAEALLGSGSSNIIQTIVSGSAVAACAILTGLSHAVFDYVKPYTKDRIVHGSPLAQKQSVAFRLADMHIDIHAMRWATWRGAVALDKKRDAAREARLAQTYCRSRSFPIADEGIQLLGGHGYVRDHPVERWYRDARTLTLLDGITGV